MADRRLAQGQQPANRVEDAVREQVEKKAREWDAEAKRDAAFPDDQRVDLAQLSVPSKGAS